MTTTQDLNELEKWIAICNRLVRLGLVDDPEWWVDHIEELEMQWERIYDCCY